MLPAWDKGCFCWNPVFRFCQTFWHQQFETDESVLLESCFPPWFFSPGHLFVPLCRKMSVLVHSCHTVLFKHFEDCYCSHFTWTGNWCSVIFRYTFSTWPQVLSNILYFIAFSASTLSLGSSDISFDHGLSPTMKRHSWIAKGTNFVSVVQGRVIQFWTVCNQPAIWPNIT